MKFRIFAAIAVLAPALLCGVPHTHAQARDNGDSAAFDSDRWVFVTTDGKSMGIWLDAERINRTSQQASVWTRWEYFEDQKGSEGREPYRYALSRETYDCANTRFKNAQRLYYASDGRVVRSVPLADTWVDVPPGSFGEDLIRRLCALVFPKD